MSDNILDGFGSRTLSAAPGWTGVAPSLDVAETDKEVVITAELPGLEEKDFDVTVAGDILTLKGEKNADHEEHNGGSYYAERRYGAFSRSVRLPSRSRTRPWTPPTTRAC